MKLSVNGECERIAKIPFALQVARVDKRLVWNQELAEDENKHVEHRQNG